MNASMAPDLVFQPLSTDPKVFPPHFVWGSATASYQVEGIGASGRGDCVVDLMARIPGKVHEGQHGQVACDHERRMEADVALMQSLGLKAYRFSLSWPRVLPEGVGKVNEAGLDFYDRLVDALLTAGIKPYSTLFHWDFPTALFARGGWQNPDSPQWFADYTELVARRLGDRITNWITLNEPQVFVGLGHEQGTHAPGLELERRQLLQVAHHVLLAHGYAVSCLRAHGTPETQIGWAPVGVTAVPASLDPADVEAARTAMFGYPEEPILPNPWDQTILWNNAFWAEPVLRGDYPAEARRILGDDLPKMTEADRAIIHQSLDFYGANIYHGKIFKAGPEGEPVAVDRVEGFPQSLFGWPITPEALYWGPRFLYEEYGLPIIVTENGISGHDWIDGDGAVQDDYRIDFTRRYLHALHQAIADGVDVRAYFHWSLMDNYEWASGYTQRFGLVHVNFQTLERTPKKSAGWYRTVMTQNAVS